MSSVYTTTKTPGELQAFLSDLLRLSLKHGVYLDAPYGDTHLRDVDPEWAGYALGSPHLTRLTPLVPNAYTEPGALLDRVSDLSTHERIRWQAPGDGA